MTPEHVPQKLVSLFQQAWHAEDARGTAVPGARTRAGLAAVLTALAEVPPEVRTGPNHPDYPHEERRIPRSMWNEAELEPPPSTFLL